MINKRYTVILLLFFFSVVLTAQEIRSGIEFDRNILPKLETEVKFQLRKVPESADYFFNSCIVQVNLGYEFIAGFRLAGTFRYTGFAKEDNDIPSIINYQDKFRITSDLGYKSKKFQNNTRLCNRLRYQKSISSIHNNKSYVRNRLKCEYYLTKKTVPYIALEPFYSFESKQFDAYRLYVGSNFELVFNSIDIYIILELNTKNGRYSSYHCLGFTYKI